MRKSKTKVPKQSESQAIPTDQPLGTPAVQVRERTPRKLAQLPRGYVPERDDMHVRLTRDDGDRIGHLKSLGYRMAKESDLKPNYPGRKEGNVIRKGKDLVAMVAPRESVEARLAEQQLRRWEMDRKVAKMSDAEAKAQAITLDDHYQEQEAIEEHRERGGSGKSYFVMPGLPGKD